MAKTQSKSEPTNKKTNSKTVAFALLFLATVLIGIGLYRLNDWREVTTTPAKLPTSEVVSQDTAEPGENKPDIEDYTVPADQPRRIILQSITSEGIIQKVGINEKNAISVPSNVHYAGWFSDSAKPGENGLSIIDGHVSGKYSDGIFKNLGKLKSGDIFEVEYGDLSKKRFEVVEVKTLAEADSAKFLLTKNDAIDRQLNLITCGGKFNNATQTYDDRIVVVSKSV